MDSSSFSELTLLQRGRVIGSVRSRSGVEAAASVAAHAIDGAAPLLVTLARSSPSLPEGRVRASGVVVLQIDAGAAAANADVSLLDGEFGEVEFAYEEAEPDGSEATTTRLQLLARVTAAPRIEEFHESIVKDLERAHTALAVDILSRTIHRASAGAFRAVLPEEEIRRLEGYAARLEDAFQTIGDQPSLALVRDVRRQRWRPGIRLRLARTAEALQDPETVVQGNRLLAIGRAMTETTRLTSDIPEHRHIRAGVERLVSRCVAIRRWCHQAAASYERERRRWSDSRTEDSPIQREIQPRIARLTGLGAKAGNLAAELRKTINRYEFISHAGKVRTRLDPTPIFLTRPGYRETYGVLRALQTSGGISLAGEELRIRFKALSRLYEYWCFISIVEIVRKSIGAPATAMAFRVVDDVYRPDLDPGQSFSFRAANGTTVHVTYEPDVGPGNDARNPAAVRPSARWRATLSSAPLRPDILIEVERKDGPPVAMVLDAKSSWRFSREDLWNPSDYRTRIVDAERSHQPVRQVFFLHPNPSIRPLESLPGYLVGRCGDLKNSIIGAVAFQPLATDLATSIVERFLGLAGVQLRAAD